MTWPLWCHRANIWCPWYLRLLHTYSNPSWNTKCWLCLLSIKAQKAVSVTTLNAINENKAVRMTTNFLLWKIFGLKPIPLVYTCMSCITIFRVYIQRHTCHVTLVAISRTTVQSWWPVFKSSHCNLFYYCAPVDLIYRCPIFKWSAVTWLHDRVPG